MQTIKVNIIIVLIFFIQITFYCCMVYFIINLGCTIYGLGMDMDLLSTNILLINLILIHFSLLLSVLIMYTYC